MIFISKLRAFLTKPVNRIESIVITVLLVPILAAAVTSAATTISTNIETGGNLSVTGTSTLMGDVGIGTTEAGYKLHVQNGTVAVVTNDSSNPNLLFSGTSVTGTNWIIGLDEGEEETGDLYFNNTPDYNGAMMKLTEDGDLYVAGKINGVKVYRALLTQTGTDAPVATVLENTLGGTVVWTRFNTGEYLGSLVGAFPEDKTLFFGARVNTNADSVIDFARNGTDQVRVQSFYWSMFAPEEPASFQDDTLSNTPIEILVYP